MYDILASICEELLPEALKIPVNECKQSCKTNEGFDLASAKIRICILVRKEGEKRGEGGAGWRRPDIADV